MAKPDDSKIEKTLRKVVKDAVKAGDDVAVNEIRKRTEERLGLEVKFLKSDAWKSRSKDIITAAFQGPEAGEEQPEKESKGEEDASKPQTNSKKGDVDDRPSSAGSGKAASQTPKRPETTAPKVNGVKRKADETESAPVGGKGGNTIPAGEATDRSPNKKTKTHSAQANKADSGSKEASSSESGESSGEEGGSEDESSESGSEESSEKPGQPSSRPTPEEAPGKSSERVIPSKAFRAPTGYTAVDPTLLSSARPFQNTQLGGQQVWHITAPFNVPLSSLTELTLSSISSRDHVLTHKGIPYILSEDETVNADSTALLMPSKDGYSKAQAGVSRTLHLQQKIDLPNISNLQASQATGSNAAGDIAQASVSTVRPQPKGLRMRYKPPGFGTGRPGRIGSGSESGDDGGDEGRPSFQFPKTLGQHGVEVKQDGDVEMVDAAEVAANGDGHAAQTPRKTKKKRKEKTVGGEADESPRVNGAPTSKNKEAGGANVNGEVEKESKEEKRRRKEEKKARKEAKAKAKDVAA